MSHDQTSSLSKLELGVLRGCRVFLMVTAPVALLLGVISLALHAIEPKPWSDFCVALGIALLVYATVAVAGLWAARQLWQPSGSAQASPAGLAAKNQEDRLPDWDTVIAFVGRLFGAILFLGVLGIGLFVSGLAAPPQVAPFWFDFGRLAGTGFLAALGFFAAGTLFGFLFGLPRSPQPTHSAPSTTGNVTPSPNEIPSATQSNDPEQKDPKIQNSAVAPEGADNNRSVSRNVIPGTDAIPTDNTNLQEISDWLTKIIVGVGLVELKDIPRELGKLSKFFADTCGTEFGGALLMMMGVFFFIIGFISSYVLARVYLKLVIALTGQVLDKSYLQKIARQEATKAAVMAVLEKTQTGAGSVGVLALISEARATINTTGVSDTQLDMAIKFLDEALKTGPPDDVKASAMVEKARALKRKALLKQGSEREALLRQALGLLAAVRQLKPDYAPAVYNTACYKALLGLPFNQIKDDLQLAFKLAPALLETAKKDEDFREMREVPEFRALIGLEKVVNDDTSRPGT